MTRRLGVGGPESDRVRVDDFFNTYASLTIDLLHGNWARVESICYVVKHRPQSGLIFGGMRKWPALKLGLNIELVIVGLV